MHENSTDSPHKTFAEQVVGRKTEGAKSAVGVLGKLFSALESIAGDNRIVQILKKNKDAIGDVLEIQTIRWDSGAKDKIFTSKKSVEHNYLGEEKPSQIIVNSDFFNIEGSRGFLKKVENGDFEATKLGSGEENMAFVTQIGTTKVVVRYPHRESKQGVNEPFFGPTGIDNYVVLRYIAEKTAVKTAPLYFATRSIMVMGMVEGRTLFDYFTQKYGENYEYSPEYKQDAYLTKLESIRNEVQESIRDGIKDGSFSLLDDPRIPKKYLDLTHNNFMLDEESQDLILFDPLSGLSSGF